MAASGWPVITTSENPRRLGRLADMVATVWRRRHEYSVAHVDVFSGLAFVWAEAACAALRRVGKPYVLTLHGGDLPAFARRWPRRVRRLLSSAAAITTPSRYLHERMTAYQMNIGVIPNPLEVAAYNYRPRTRPSPKLIWVRAFHEIYEPPLAVKVLKTLAREFPQVELTMLGHDKGDGSLQAVVEEAADSSITERLKLPGGVARAEVPEWLCASDVFLNTSNVDNTPVSVMEAMACGLSIVSTNVGGIPYLLKDGRDALLVPQGDAQAMAAAVRRVLTEPGLSERLSLNARRKVEAFDWPLIIPQWEKLFGAIASAGQR
jgi:glycosyltransferase involved in cell wall biosynthesis